MNGLQFADNRFTSSPGTLRVAVRLLSGLAGLVAILDLAGWCFHFPALVGIFQQTVTMKPNTAISILFLAVVMWLMESEKHFAFLKGLLLWSVLVLAILTLLEYQTGHDFHIDQLLGHVSPDKAGDPVGRMAIGTALDASLSASALLLLDVAPAFGILLASCAGFARHVGPHWNALRCRAFAWCTFASLDVGANRGRLFRSSDCVFPA
ncbi:MAG: hypothetical protein ACRYFU_20270 [Janthinobacterium lividum]